MRILFLLFLFLLSASPLLAGDINLSAAASMKDVMNELTDRFAKSHYGVTFHKNYGGSGAIARQIENGAPSDIYISANQKWMLYLKEKTLLDVSSITTFTYNTLVFAGITDKAHSMKDLVKLERIAIGSPGSVPAGEYAIAAIKKGNLDKALENKLVMARDVRECLMYAERGEVDGAVVYKTDALMARKARILFTIPQELYPKVIYPMALTVDGAKNSDASAFFAYLLSGEAETVLTKYGFATR